jgi:hypothetical protein
VKYRLWASLDKTQSEFQRNKPIRIALEVHSLKDALWCAMNIGRGQVAWEIEGEDGSRLDRQGIVEMVRQLRHELIASYSF